MIAAIGECGADAFEGFLGGLVGQADEDGLKQAATGDVHFDLARRAFDSR